MGTFFASRRNQVVVGIVAVIFVVLAAFFLGLGGAKKIDVSSAGTAVVSPSASDSPSPSPLPDPSPSPTVVAVAPPSPVPPPSAAPSLAPASSPTVTAPALTSAGHELSAPSGPAPADRLGSGAPCYETWMDPGWTIDHTADSADCGILAIRGPNQDGSVAFVIEHKGTTNIKRRVYLMTGTDAWHVSLAAVDETGTRYDKIGVRQGNIAGAPHPQVLVGFRINGTGHFLAYDIVDMAANGALTVAGSRSLDHGSVNIIGNQLVDYAPYPNAQTPDYFVRTVIGYGAGAYRLVNVTHAPERGPGDLVPPP